MSADLYRELAWLPKPPADFSIRCKELANGSDGAPGQKIRALATHALDERQLSRLGRTIQSLQLSGESLTPLTPFRLGLIGNGTLDLIVPVLVATAARHGFALECITGAYDQFLQDALQPDSLLNKARPDAVLLAIDYRGLSLQPCPGNEQMATA
ncbi:MAG TPA: haloacid dehalogenase, partial [Phyllobacterium sp.]|nr:haloacid dehalogenase [Phyllobacterium sp.]